MVLVSRAMNPSRMAGARCDGHNRKQPSSDGVFLGQQTGHTKQPTLAPGTRDARILEGNSALDIVLRSHTLNQRQGQQKA